MKVVWINYTYNDRRGPNKRFLEMVIGLNKIDSNMQHIAVFPEAPEDSNMVRLCEENSIEYYFCNICWFANLCSNNVGVRQATFKQFLINVDNLTEILQRTQCDLIVSNTTLVWEAGIAAKRLGIKHVTLIKGVLNPYDFSPNEVNFKILRELEKDLIRLSDYFVTHSYYTACLWKIDKETPFYKRIPLGVKCIGEWTPLKLEASPLKIVTFASIEENKNIGYIIEIAKILKERNLNCEFSVYGYVNDPDYKKRLDEMIKKDSLFETVKFYDYQQNIDEVFNYHHIVFLPSILESFGATILEGMARCRPVISVKCGGPEEIIEDCVNGFLIEAYQPEQAADKFEFFIKSPDQIEQFGLQGHRQWKEGYTVEVSINRWKKFLDDILLNSRKTKKYDCIQTIDNFKSLLDLPIESTCILTNNCIEKKGQLLNKNMGIWRIITHLPSTNASLKLGLLNSLDYLTQNGYLNYEISNPEKIKADENDVLVFIRTLDKNTISLLESAKANNIRTIYYVDDCLFMIPDYAKNSHHYNHPDVQDILKTFVQNTDQLVCCSEWLSEVYEKKYDVPSTWIQPAIEKCSYPIRKKNKESRLVIGYAGNIDHAVPLEALRDTFLKLKAKYGAYLQFEFIGAKPSFLNEVNAIYFPPMSYTNYEMLMARRCWDIGIAYLEDTNFNNYKYYNKFIEYSKFNVAGIYSNIELFRRIIEPNRNGLLAEHHFYDWYEKIDMLIQNSMLREGIIKSSHKQVINTYGVKAGAQSIIDHLLK